MMPRLKRFIFALAVVAGMMLVPFGNTAARLYLWATRR